jgi:hypothetical protein
MLQRNKLEFLSELVEGSSQYIDWTEYESDTMRRVLDFMLQIEGNKMPLRTGEQNKTTPSGASSMKELSSISIKSDETTSVNHPETTEAPFRNTKAFISKTTTIQYLKLILQRREEEEDVGYIEDDKEEIGALTKVYSFAEEQGYQVLKEVAFEKLALVLGGIKSIDEDIYEAVAAASRLISDRDESEKSSGYSLLRLLAHFVLLHLDGFIQIGIDLQRSAPIPQKILEMLPKWLEVGKNLQESEKRRLVVEQQNQILRTRVKQLIARKDQGDKKSARSVKNSTKANTSTIEN